jgi:uncharacterized spore protein YtfJ
MNVHQLLEDLAQRVSSSASVKHVYSDPVVSGDRTVIPAARVQYAFGGGGGGGAKGEIEAQSGGGGGRVSSRPCGALEITPDSTRYIDFEERQKLGIALSLGVLLGAAIVALANRDNG